MLLVHFAYFVLISVLLQVRQVFATNVIIATTFTGLQGDYNLGHSGYIYLQSDAKYPELELSNCQYYDVNQTTCNFADKSPKTDSHVLVLRAWTALTLRDNVLVLLGYLMHQPNETFTEDTRSALRLLYEEIRRNNVKSMDLLTRIKSMAKTNQVSQVFALLKALQNIAPPFCRGAVEEIEKTFTKKKEALTKILEAQKSVDLFTDIGLQMVPLLRIKNTKRNYDKDVETMMGKEFSIFFAAIQEGRIVLTQPVLAVFTLNMKFNEMSVEETEDLRFLCDILRANKIPDWSPGLSGPCCGNFKDPYDLVETMMRTIVKRPRIDSVIKATIVKLLPRLVKLAEPNLNSERMDRFFIDSNFNVSLFLETLNDEAAITEVTGFRQMVGNGTINLVYALKGFVRYYYDTPRKIVVAFMERIRYRVPMSNAAKNYVDAILSHLRAEQNGKLNKNSSKFTITS